MKAVHDKNNILTLAMAAFYSFSWTYRMTNLLLPDWKLHFAESNFRFGRSPDVHSGMFNCVKYSGNWVIANSFNKMHIFFQQGTVILIHPALEGRGKTILILISDLYICCIMVMRAVWQAFYTTSTSTFLGDKVLSCWCRNPRKLWRPCGW